MNNSQQEVTSLTSLAAILVDTIRLLDNQDTLSGSESVDLFYLAEQANKIRALVSQKLNRVRQLEEEVLHLKTVQRIAKAGSWEVDLTGEVDSKQHYWSEELFDIVGVEPSSIELTYQSYLALIHPDDQGLFEREVSLALASKGSYDIEYRISGKNGVGRVVRDVGRVLVDHNTGMNAKMVGVTFDITEAKETQQALSRANQELQILFNTTGEVMWSTDTVHNRVLQMSPACKKVYGYEPHEMISDPDLWFKVIIEQDKPLIQEKVPALSSGQTVSTEYRIKRKDGQVGWLETRMTPTLSIDGEMIRLDGINSDITARKKAEMALRNSELRFRSLIENSNDAITIADPGLYFIFASESITTMTGHRPDELLKRSILEFIHPENHSMVQEMVAPLTEKPGEAIYFEARFRTKDGRWLWIEGHVTNLLADEAVGGYVANFRDVTARKQYERSLEFSNQQLRKTNRELDRFVYSVSHDLRAPLASVLGLLDYCKTETEDEDVLGYLKLMRESVEKLDIFILDILDYSRNARVEVKNQQIDFHELLSEVNNSLKFMSAGKSDVKMRINIQKNDTFHSDKSRIGIVLNNLVSNSIRYHNAYNPDPYVQVDVSFNNLGADLIIKDNGIGIAPEYHQKIFDMFFRVSNQSTGSGLGLYLVKETVDKLNGRLEFTSEPGIGTEFKIFLPNLDEN